MIVHCRILYVQLSGDIGVAKSIVSIELDQLLAYAQNLFLGIGIPCTHALKLGTLTY